MRRSFAATVGALAVLLAITQGPAAWAKVYVAEPLLVAQPAYAGMQFYVYKPYNMPKNWYATFDGYPVIKNKDGVWVYGTYSGPNLTPTNYIVGSVIPSMAGLSPYTGSVQISSVTTLPQPGQMQGGIAVRQPETVRVPAGGANSTYMPDWLFNDRFMALGKWKKSVDRIGILHKPGVPVAWSGNSPKVVYAWNGRSWYQMTAREGQRPVDVLKNNMYELARMANHNNFVWYEADMPVLSQQATVWGYYWMGEILPR